MLWWFLILAASATVVLWVGIALYLRLRRHLKASHKAVQGTLEEVEMERKQEAGQI